MSHWPRVRLDQCTEIVSGATPDTSEPTYWDGSICWATPKDLSELDGAYISDTPRKITHRGLESCAASVLPPESVLFSSRAPIGHVAINTVPMATNQGFKSFVPDRQKVDPRFLFHWLRKNRSYLESLGNGATFKEVSKAVVSRIEIALPSLPEQRRIADILDKADALRARRRAALVKLDHLTRSIFLAMFGDPTVNPRGWPKEPLLQHSMVTYGFPFDSQYFGSEGKWKVVRIRDVARGDSETYYSGSESFEARHVVKNGDILVGMDGEFNCARWKGGEALLNQRVCKFGATDKGLEVDFLFSVLPAFLKRIEAETPFVTVKHLSAKQINHIRVPLPPLTLQREFARRLAVVNQQVAATDASAATMCALSASLQHRAFRGEL